MDKQNYMINIEAIDRKGNIEKFDVSTEEFQLNKYPGKRYEIRTNGYVGWKHYEFIILFIDDNRILIYRVVNNDVPELTGKGITKAMIESIRKEYNMVIISSTRLDNKKIDVTEGRIDTVSRYWKKWTSENPKIIYISSEDRFIYNL